MHIKNIVFDIGNVLVKWDPAGIIEVFAPNHPDKETLHKQLFKSPIWYDLNLGKISIETAVQLYNETTSIPAIDINQLYDAIKKSLVPIDQSFELLEKLSHHYDLYALTDNVHEIVIYLKDTYPFWDRFLGAVVSAEVGYLKPAPEIYSHLINEYNLKPDETLFIDDLMINVEGARLSGIHSFQFVNVPQCIEAFKQFSIIVE